MSFSDSAPVEVGSRGTARINPDAPWAWLGAGWRDLWTHPAVSLSYGLVFAAVSGLITLALFRLDLQYLLMPLAAGFMLVGPMLAVGLYETSRRIHAGEPVSLGAALFVRTASPTQLAFLGAILMFLLLAWIRVAQLLYALFFGMSAFPGFEDTVHMVFFTDAGFGMLVVGTLVGGVIAAVVFAVSAFSVPMLMVRDVDAISAAIASVNAVRDNLYPLAVWGALVVMITAVGMVTFYVGLIIAFPLIGHATWHAYRHVVEGVSLEIIEGKTD